MATDDSAAVVVVVAANSSEQQQWAVGSGQWAASISCCIMLYHAVCLA
jgi:hypothetical protein